MTIHGTIAQLKSLMEKATPAPWQGVGGFVQDMKRCHGVVCSVINCDGDTLANRAAIVAMRNAMPALLDHIERLEAVAKAARDLIPHIDALEAELPLHYHSCSGSCIDDFCAKCRGEDVVKRHIDENAALYDRSLALTEVAASAIAKLDAPPN